MFKNSYYQISTVLGLELKCLQKIIFVELQWSKAQHVITSLELCCFQDNAIHPRLMRNYPMYCRLVTFNCISYSLLVVHYAENLQGFPNVLWSRLMHPDGENFHN
jgi:hypothetical protein